MLTFEIAITFAIVLMTVLLLVIDKLPIDLVALLALCSVLLTGLVTPEQGFAGFSNPATVTIASMFVLSAGLHRSGALSGLGEWVAALTQKNLTLALLALMTAVATLSAFMNNTAVVALFLPILMEAARKSRVSPSKLLIPLSFASMFGGACTLVGTSTNLLVDEISTRSGGAGISMFELAPLGVPLAAVGFIYLLVFGVPTLASRRGGEALTEDFGMTGHLSRVTLRGSDNLRPRPIQEWDDLKHQPLDLLEVKRPGTLSERPSHNTALAQNDVLTLRLDAPNSLQTCHDFELDPRPISDEMLQTSESALVEFLVPPDVKLEGGNLSASGVLDQSVVPLAIRNRSGLVHQSLREEPLQGGDSILVRVDRDRIEQLARSLLLMVSAPTVAPSRRSPWWPLTILVAVIVISALDWLPLAIAAPVGCVAMIISRCITLEEAYRAIEWKVVVLLGGMLALGEAMENSGTTAWLASEFLRASDQPLLTLAILYLATIGLTSIMSNNATAVLMAPLAITAAENLNVSAQPFLIAVTLAASSCFSTPIGYQTNVMVYGPGHYRFSDFLKVGLPLNLIFFIISIVAIPRIWSF